MTTDPKIVAIHGAPRSGTSWLGQIFNSNPEVAYRYQPFFSYAFRDRISSKSTSPELERFFADLLSSRDDFVLQRGNAKLAHHNPTFSKVEPSHLVYKEVRFHHLLPHLLESIPKLKVIGLIRDPRSVLASWFRAPREFNASWLEAEEWRFAERKNEGRIENWYGFERWKALATMLLDLADHYPERCKIIRYEHLVQATDLVVDELFEFCAIKAHPQTHQFIVESTTCDNDDPYGVYRHNTLQNRGPNLSAELSLQIVSEIQGTDLEPFLAD